MPTMVREASTDERLDDLVKHMDENFERVDKNFERVDKNFERVHAEIRNLRSDMRQEMKEGFAAMNRTLQIAGGLIAAMFVGLMGLIGTQL